MIAWLYIRLRWMRLTTRRFGSVALFSTYRSRHAGFGHGVWENPFGRQHDARIGTGVWSVIARLELERATA